MALPASGAISLNNVNVELGLTGTTSINMNQASVRTLFAVPSGAISMSNGYGKSNAVVVSTIGVSGTTSYDYNGAATAAWTVLITYSNASTSTNCTLLTWGQYTGTYPSGTAFTGRPLVVASASVTISTNAGLGNIGGATGYIQATDTSSGVKGYIVVTWTCLPLKTLISMADGTQKQMGQIEVGEMVKAIDPVTKEFSDEKVTFVLEPSRASDLVKITCEDNIILEPTPEHEVWIRRGSESMWSNAVDLLVGDEMLTDDLQYKKILSVELTNYSDGVEVGNISVANAKVYFAEHLLMHNTGGL
jgi:hypothetical protein